MTGVRSRGRLLRGEHGQVLVLFVVLLVVLLGMAAIALDAGRAYVAQRQLRGVADAAAVAAANDLPVANTVCNQAAPNGLPNAWAYSASNVAGCPLGKNVIPTLSNVQTSVQVSCLSQYVSSGTAPPCRASQSGGSSQNAVTVTESASVPLTFAKVLPGLPFSSWSVKATSTALMHGGAPHPADIMIVLDRTGSMTQTCTAGGTKLSCAQAGVNAFLQQMLPSQDLIGFETFPPVNVAAPAPTASYATVQTNACTATGSTNTAYYDNGQAGATLAQKAANPNWAYVIVPLANDFRATDTSPTLNAASNLVKTVACLKPASSNSNGTSYADAIDIASQYLAANGRPNAQDVIVFLSDGEANYGPVYHSAAAGTITLASEQADPYRTTPCHQAINSSRTATNAGDWVYTIAYDAGTSSSSPSCLGWTNTSSCDAVATTAQFNTCGVEQPVISAFTTMLNMASDSGKFFFNPSPSSLTAYFQAVAQSITTPRLIFVNGPDNSP
jgi:Flp pilus assembly protein TadG